MMLDRIDPHSRATMTFGDAPFPVHPGDVIYVPQGIYHGTLNTGWSPMRLIALYNPGGAEERALTMLPDFAEVPAGAVPMLARVLGGSGTSCQHVLGRN